MSDKSWYKVVFRWREKTYHAEMPVRENDTREKYTMCNLEIRKHEWKPEPKGAVNCQGCLDMIVRYNTEAVEKVGWSKRRSSDGWMRPTIVLQEGGASVELIGKNGQLICLLNFATNPEDGDGWANVDVILTEGPRNTHKLTAISWHEGKQAFRQESPSGLVAVDISLKQEVKS